MDIWISAWAGFNGLYIFDKKSSGANTSGVAVTHANKSAFKKEILLNQQVAEELQIPFIR